MSTLQLGSLVFEETARAGWVFSDLLDWFGQTDDKIEITERPQAHGAFDVNRSLRTSRAISFTGAYIGEDQTDVENAFDDLSSVGAEGPVELIFSTPAGVTSRTVTVERVTPVDHHGQRYGRYSVDLIARDPRRYDVNADLQSTHPAQPGQGRTWPAVWPLVWPGGGSSGRITLTNTGKAPSAPTFILSGGFDTALITCLETGARIGLNRLVPVGSNVVIDTKTRRATIDGQSDVSRWLQFREWELIPGGESRTYQFDATGVAVVPGVESEIARNLIPNPAPASGTGWTSLTGASVSYTGGLIQVVAPGVSANEGVQVATASRAASPASAGIWVNAPLGTELYVQTRANGSAAGAVQVNFAATGSWQFIKAEGASLPAFAGPHIVMVRTRLVQAVTFQVRRAIVEERETVGDYFDGNTPPVGYRRFAWEGLADASASIAYERTPDTVTARLEGQVRSAWW